MELTCKDRCLRYLKKHPNEWIAKGHICDVAQNNSTFIGETIGRALRKLAEAKEIEVTQIKNHAHYRYVERVYS